MRRNKVVAALAALLILAGVTAASVVKTTTKTPTSFTTSFSTSSIGVAFAFHGPGAIAGTTCGAFSVTSGSLTKTAEGSHMVSYDATGGNNYRLLTTVVVGISFSYAKKISILWWSGGSMTSTNWLDYAVTKDEDGDVQVVLSGFVGTSAQTGVNSSQFKPLFKFYGTLVNFTNHASLETWVSSTSTITATPISTGLANGQVAGFVFGIP